MTDIQVAPGEDLTLQIPVTNPDGTPRDVTGAIGEFPVHDAPRSATVLFAGTMTVIDGPGGLLAYLLPGTATSSFASEFHVLYYELWLVDAGGARTRLDDGKMILA
jgi:hypothetical protein